MKKIAIADTIWRFPVIIRKRLNTCNFNEGMVLGMLSDFTMFIVLGCFAFNEEKKLLRFSGYYRISDVCVRRLKSSHFIYWDVKNGMGWAASISVFILNTSYQLLRIDK